MTQAYYPKLDIGGLAAIMAIRQQSEMFPDYFEQKACPYDQDTIKQLNKLFQIREVEKIVEKIVEREVKIETAHRAAEGGGVGPKKVKLKTSGVDLDAVSKEIQDIREELKTLKTDSFGMETGDRIQIIKTRAALVEKLISMDDRVNNLKRLSLYQSVVMGILDDLIPEEGRKQFIRRIEPFAKEETG